MADGKYLKRTPPSSQDLCREAYVRTPIDQPYIMRSHCTHVTCSSLTKQFVDRSMVRDNGSSSIALQHGTSAEPQHKRRTIPAPYALR